MTLLSRTNGQSWDFLDVFKKKDACPEEVHSAGERLFLKLYGAKETTTLDKYRHVRYKQQISRKALTTNFQLESLPPTSSAAQYHSFRSYLTIQLWLGNDEARATDWGWIASDDRLVPVATDRPVAPERILRMISCGCKQNCQKLCKCRKAGLYCSEMCTNCAGVCRNRDMSEFD